MGRIIGIDLGTTNSVAAYWKRRGPKPIRGHFDSPLTPSVVSLEQGRRIVGRNALDRRDSGSKNVIYSAKRFIGRDFDDEQVQKALTQVGYEAKRAANGEVELCLDDKYYSPVEIAAMVLEQIKKDAEMVLGEEVTHAVITVPAYFSQRQKNATREAGQLADLKVLRIINEPTAAALAFGIEESSEDAENILVYDLGGGTFDISVLLVAGGNFDVLHIDGDNFLGGDDFDQRLVERMLGVIKDQYGESLENDVEVLNRLKKLAEETKIILSRDQEYTITKGGSIAKTRAGRPINLDMSITRDQFETMIEDLVERTVQIIKRALNDAEMVIGDIDRVLLVGGSTRIPLVRKRLRKLFGDSIEIDVDPMLCVALGAAIQTTLPIEWLCQNCRTVNEGSDETCTKCNSPKEIGQAEALPQIVCDECGKNNRQGKRNCWNCGAIIGATGFENEIIRVTDVTAKYIGVETEDPDSPFAVVIEKGTVYPTDEPFKRLLYTTRFGQDFYELPVFEAEGESLTRQKWEQTGVIYNDKLPPGLPKNTPIIVEMRIDGDGVLTVWSYVKRMEDETLAEGKFSFSGTTSRTEVLTNQTIESLEFNITMLKAIQNGPSLNKYLNVDQNKKIHQLIEQSEASLGKRDASEIETSLKQIKQFRKDLPVPVEDLFWATSAAYQEPTSYTDRNQTIQIITRMERAISDNDIDTANQYLHQLRDITEKMFSNLPTNLLKQVRG